MHIASDSTRLCGRGSSRDEPYRKKKEVVKMYFEFDFDSTGRAWSLCKVNIFQGIYLLIFGKDFCRFVRKSQIVFVKNDEDKVG